MSTDHNGLEGFTTMDDMACNTFQERLEVEFERQDGAKSRLDIAEEMLAAESIRIKSTVGSDDQKTLAGAAQNRSDNSWVNEQRAKEALDLAIRAGPTEDLIARAKAFYAFLSNPSA